MGSLWQIGAQELNLVTLDLAPGKHWDSPEFTLAQGR